MTALSKRIVTSLCLAAASVVAGCGATTAPPVRTDGSGAVQVEYVSPAHMPATPSLQDPVGARADVQLDSCSTAAGQATAHGTVTNSTDQTTEYAITVSWINDRSDVMARGVTVIHTLTPHERRPWTTTATLPSGTSTCTIFAEREGQPGATRS